MCAKIRPELARNVTAVAASAEKNDPQTRQRERDGFLTVPPSASLSSRVRARPLIRERKMAGNSRARIPFSPRCWLRACDAGNHGNRFAQEGRGRDAMS